MEQHARLVSYNLATGALRDHGALYGNGRRVLGSESMAVGLDGTLWALALAEAVSPALTTTNATPPVAWDLALVHIRP